MIYTIFNFIMLIACMMIAYTLTFLMGSLASMNNRKASHAFCTAWLTSAAGFGGCLYLVLKLMEVI